MTVRIVQKNSVAEDKRPTAGQLANGEIAVNLHEAGAFLSIKDTAGNVQQVGGVKVSNNSPANPVKGTFWLDSDNNTLFIYDGTQWRGVTGGGGGGGSSINLAEGDAINISQAGSTYTINVVAGAGITLAGDNVAVELDNDATTVGLKMVGAGDAGKLSAKVATGSTLGSVKVDGTTITVDGAGQISAILPDPLTYKGNINPTTEDGGADAIPTGSVGDAYTCSWGGTNVEGNLDNSPNWLNAIKGSDTTATLGDLLIINSGDGSGANEWTLVKTGTVDSGASIDVGDGDTASFPPASPQEGDVWYNTDDARTYVYITDSSGDTVWVDISPQGNQTLWKKDTAGIIQPQTDADTIRLPKLASNSTAGTRIAMLDGSQNFVANTVGAGLEIDSGVLKVRDSGSGKLDLQMVTDNGNATTNGADFGGDVKAAAFDIANNTTAKGARIGQFGVTVQRAVTGGSVNDTVFTGYRGATQTSSIKADGGAEFAGNVQSGSADTTSETTAGATLNYRGNILIQRPDGATSSDVYFSGYSGTTRTVRINGNGSASFDDNVNSKGVFYSTRQSGNSRCFVGSQDGAENIVLLADGSASFAGTIKSTTWPTTGYELASSGSLGLNAAGGTSGNMLVLKSGSTTAASITGDGNADFAGKITLTGTSVEGIQFGSTDSGGNIDSQTLNDYEEGTFTPVLTMQTSGSVTVSGTLDTFAYTKVGRKVTVTGLIGIASVSSPVGTLQISLPFSTPSTNAATFQCAASVTYFDDDGGSGDDRFISAPSVLSGNTNNLRIMMESISVTPAANDQIMLSLTYFTNT